VRAWIVDDFPAAFTDWNCQVTALELARTFWEKATILHAEHHRPEEQATPDRYARHYYDMARLLAHPDADTMLADDALCGRVVEWKSRVFARQWARYELAKPGTFRLLPPAIRRAALARDYAQMRAMFLVTPREFDAVLGVLDAAERRLNAPP
jgi:Nucleotidyl transferase AbiEii toxin, Type IV TA system